MENLRIGVQLTTSCNAACLHCGTSSSPKAKLTFSLDLLQQLITQVSEISTNGQIAFTGGEVFYVRDLLFQGINAARALHLKYGITTNGFWGQDVEERRKVLNEIADCSNLGLSLDVYHDPFIDRQAVVQTFREATDRGIRTVLRYTFTAQERPEQVLSDLGLTGTKYAASVHFNGLMAVGRAAGIKEPDIFPVHPLDEPCLAASLATVRATGDVFACCGESFYLPGDHALKIGNIQQNHLKYILKERTQNVVLVAIQTLGPRRLLEKCDQSHHPRFDALSRSPCGACRLLLGSETAQADTKRVCREVEPQTRLLRALYYGELTSEVKA